MADIVVGDVGLISESLDGKFRSRKVLTFDSTTVGLTIALDPDDPEIHRLTQPGQRFIVRLQPVKKGARHV